MPTALILVTGYTEVEKDKSKHTHFLAACCVFEWQSDHEAADDAIVFTA